MLEKLVPLTLLATGLVAAPALATTYCVDDAACVAGGGTAQPTLEAALAAAGTGSTDDVVQLGEGTFTAQTAAGFRLTGDPFAVDVRGRGVGKTVLTGPTGVQQVLMLVNGKPSAVSDLTVAVPADAGTGPATAYGLSYSGHAERVEVTTAPKQSHLLLGAYLYEGSTLEDADVAVTGDYNSVAISLGGDNAVVRRVTARGARGIATGGSVASPRIERARIVSQSTGIELNGTGTSVVRSSVVDVQSPINAAAVSVNLTGGKQGDVTLDGLTLHGAPNGHGVFVSAAGAGGKLAAHVRNTLISGPGHSITHREQNGGDLVADVAYSDLDPTTVLDLGGDLTASDVTTTADPLLDDALSPKLGSALIDAGDPAVTTGEDVLGNPLLGRRDIGAFEYHPPKPAAPAPAPAEAEAAPAATAPSTVAPAAATTPVVPRATPVVKDTRAPRIGKVRVRRGRLTFTLDERATVKITAGRRKLTVRGKAGLNRVRLPRGTKRVRLVATDAAGNRAVR